MTGRPERLMLLVLLIVPAGAAWGDQQPTQYFAWRVVEYSPGEGNDLFPDPLLALGGPRGAGTTAGTLDAVTLGVQGVLVLGFEPGQAIHDEAGADFIVAENPFGAFLRFAELVRVGVSSNGQDYAYFPVWCGLTAPVPAYMPIDPSQVGGFAGIEPVHANVGPVEDGGNDLDPFDPVVAGGDPFDLADLAGDPLAVAGTVRLDRITHVRLVDVLGDGTEQDSDGNAVYDPSGLMDSEFGEHPVSADIDALTVIHGLPRPASGDADRSGAVDLDDMIVLAQNWGRSPASWDEGDLDGDGAVGPGDLETLARSWSPVGQAPAAVPEPAAALVAAGGGMVLLGRRRRRNGR